MLAPAVSRGERTDNLITPLFVRNGVFVTNRLRRQHGRAGIEVSKINLMSRAVRVRRPEMMVMHLRSVDVFPAHVDKLTVRQNPGRVFLFRVAGNGVDVFSVGTAAIQRRYAHKPALHPAFGA